MKITKEEYSSLVSKATPPSPKAKNFVWAFFVGGCICAVSQVFKTVYLNSGLTEDNAYMLTSVTIILITAILTGTGVFDKIAKHAGAGTLVPVSGFANAVVSPAIEFKSESIVLGLTAKLFSIAGPVLVFGISASVVYGIIYYFFG